MSAKIEGKAVAEILIDVFDSGHKVLICGNGGSSAEADHFVGELLGHYKLNRKPLPAISLSHFATVSAIGNDECFDNVFSRQVEALGNRGDCLVCLSTSGKSPNIIKAVATAIKKKMVLCVFIPRQDNEIGDRFGACQERHLKVIHQACEIIDKHYAKNSR